MVGGGGEGGGLEGVQLAGKQVLVVDEVQGGGVEGGKGELEWGSCVDGWWGG